MKFLFWTLVVTLFLALVNWITYWFGLDIAGIAEPVNSVGVDPHAGEPRSPGAIPHAPVGAHASASSTSHGPQPHPRH